MYARALVAVPNDASLRHAFALHLVRERRWTEAAEQALQGAELQADNPQLASVYVLVLDRLGRTGEALGWLQQRLGGRDGGASFYSEYGDKQLINLGISLSPKVDDSVLVGWFKSRRKL